MSIQDRKSRAAQTLSRLIAHYKSEGTLLPIAEYLQLKELYRRDQMYLHFTGVWK